MKTHEQAYHRWADAEIDYMERLAVFLGTNVIHSSDEVLCKKVSEEFDLNYQTCFNLLQESYANGESTYEALSRAFSKDNPFYWKNGVNE